MTANPAQIIVTAEDDIGAPAPTLQVHHRNFPEIEAEGETEQAAATNLGERLQKALDAVPDSWHRASLEQAIEDLRAFVAQPR
jgi:hypothetical protein